MILRLLIKLLKIDFSCIKREGINIRIINYDILSKKASNEAF